MDRVYEVSGYGLAAILLSAFALGYAAIGYSVWQWMMILRGLA